MYVLACESKHSNSRIYIAATTEIDIRWQINPIGALDHPTDRKTTFVGTVINMYRKLFFFSIESSIAIGVLSNGIQRE